MDQTRAGISREHSQVSIRQSLKLTMAAISTALHFHYNIARNDEKARLDNYVIQLQNQPGAMGYIIVYPARRASANEAQARATRISDYLVNTRGIEASRFHIMMGPAREDWLFELWIVPTGAPPPTPSR